MNVPTMPHIHNTHAAPAAVALLICTPLSDSCQGAAHMCVFDSVHICCIYCQQAVFFFLTVNSFNQHQMFLIEICGLTKLNLIQRNWLRIGLLNIVAIFDFVAFILNSKNNVLAITILIH